MSRTVFGSISSQKLANLIRRASIRVFVAAPAIRGIIADAIVEFWSGGEGRSVEVIVDCDEEVFRLGYGEVNAIQKLRKAGIPLRQNTGLRIGVAIVDDIGCIFAPTALYVQDEVHSDETPNAVRVSPQEAQRIVERLSYEENAALAKRVLDGISEVSANETLPKIEVGQSAVSEERLASVARELKSVPPVPFDISRQVRVFQPYIQYVEISLLGCAIQRRRVKLPPSIIKMGEDVHITDRIHTSFELIERGSQVSSKKLEDELRKLRETYTRALGKPWGRVLLRAKRDEFDQAIEKFRHKVSEHEKQVSEQLEHCLAKSLDEVVAYYMPIVIEQPPVALSSQIMTEKPTEEQAESWLREELRGVIPSAKELITAMKLEVHFRDVTYETLQEPGFDDALRAAYPFINWDKPFSEFNAAREKVAAAESR